MADKKKMPPEGKKVKREDGSGSALTGAPRLEIKNALIERAAFDTERGLSAWLYLDYGGSGQGFGGYLLYGPHGWKANSQPGNFAGHFIWRVLEIAGVDDWENLKGKTIRVKSEHSKIHAIGHIVKEDWFNPSEEFAAIIAQFETPKASVSAPREPSQSLGGSK